MDSIFEKGLELYKKKEYEKAFALFCDGSKQEDCICIHAMGLCYFNGKGVEKDENKGRNIVLANIDCLEQCGINNIPWANNLLALAYSYVDFLKNDKKRFEALKRIYENKVELNCDFLIDYAKCYKNGSGTKQNYKTAHNLFKECYEKFNSEIALYELAQDYQEGMYARKDEEKAYQMFEECYKKYEYLPALEKMADLKHYGYLSDTSKYVDLLNEGNKLDKNNTLDFNLDLFKVCVGLDSLLDNVGNFINFDSAIEIAEKGIEERNETFWSILLAVAHYLKGNEKTGDNIIAKIDAHNHYEVFEQIWLYVLIFGHNKWIVNVNFANFEHTSLVFYEKLKKIEGSQPNFYQYLFYNFCSTVSAKRKTEKLLNEKGIKYLKHGVSNNEPSSLAWYSSLLRDGEMVKKDISQSFNCLKKACDFGVKMVEPCYFVYLAQYYEYGLGTKKDFDKALELYKYAYKASDDNNNAIDKINSALCIMFLCKDRKDKTELYKEMLSFVSSVPGLVTTIYCFNPSFLKDGSRTFWYASLLYNNFGIPAQLADCYRYGIGVNKDIEKAIELYESIDDIFASEYLCQIGKMYYYGEEIEKDINLAEQYFLKSNSDRTKYYIRDAYIHLFYIYSDKSSKKYDIQKAIKFLHLAANEEERETFLIENAFYLLGATYQSSEHGLKDLKAAKQNYLKGQQYGLNCQYALESVERDIAIDKFYSEGITEGKQQGIRDDKLPKFAAEYAREAYAKSMKKGLLNFTIQMLHTGASGAQRKFMIENEMADDFGEVWDDLKSSAKQAIVTAIFTYSTLIEMGYDSYSQMDFSPIVNGLSKAFEIELKEFFSTGFLKYLKKHDIDHEEFVNESAKQQVPFINEEVRMGKSGIPTRYYSYVENDEGKSFSLGQVYYIVTIGHNNNFYNSVIDKRTFGPGLATRKSILTGERINEHIVDYFDEVFSDDEFSSFNRKQEIANYLIDLANDIKTIRIRRNTGTHEASMTADDAEVCADYLIKIRKVIYGFVSKIKKEYRQGYFIKKHFIV